MHEYATATGDTAVRAAADRAVQLFLEHRLLYRLGTEQPIDQRWLQLRYPSYWRYDLLRVLRLLTRMGRIGDLRAGAALRVLRAAGRLEL